jgi:hypothetical protein
MGSAWIPEASVGVTPRFQVLEDRVVDAHAGAPHPAKGRLGEETGGDASRLLGRRPLEALRTILRARTQER